MEVGQPAEAVPQRGAGASRTPFDRVILGQVDVGVRQGLLDGAEGRVGGQVAARAAGPGRDQAELGLAVAQSQRLDQAQLENAGADAGITHAAQRIEAGVEPLVADFRA